MNSFLSQPRTQISFNLSACLTFLVITGLTILDETVPSLHTWLTATFTHHWLGKSVLSLLVLVVAWVIFRLVPWSADDRRVVLTTQAVAVVALLSAAALLIFFGLEVWMK